MALQNPDQTLSIGGVGNCSIEVGHHQIYYFPLRSRIYGTLSHSHSREEGFHCIHLIQVVQLWAGNGMKSKSRGYVITRTYSCRVMGQMSLCLEFPNKMSLWQFLSSFKHLFKLIFSVKSLASPFSSHPKPKQNVKTNTHICSY